MVLLDRRRAHAELVGVWWVARAGQKLAAPQTLVLRHFLEEVLQVDESQRLRTDADPYRE